MQLHDLTLVELSTGLSAKHFSSRDVVDALLGRIAKADGKLHAFTEVYASEARALADAADKARTSGFPLGPLHGLPAGLAPAGRRCSRSAWRARPPTPSSG
jgi:aspartyl-tRNA(Asn)/glutamyl-tRNA(Gln) amidotransferase subunit A